MADQKQQSVSAVNQDFKKFDQVRKDQTYRLASADEAEEFDEDYQIKVCDFADFSAGGQADRHRFAQSLGMAMEDIGFAILINHGIDPELLDTAYEKMIDHITIERVNFHAADLLPRLGYSARS